MLPVGLGEVIKAAAQRLAVERGRDSIGLGTLAVLLVLGSHAALNPMMK